MSGTGIQEHFTVFELDTGHGPSHVSHSQAGKVRVQAGGPRWIIVVDAFDHGFIVQLFKVVIHTNDGSREGTGAELGGTEESKSCEQRKDQGTLS